MNKPETRCPICGYDFDRGNGLPEALPPRCPHCNEKQHLDHLITEDDDCAWDY